MKQGKKRTGAHAHKVRREGTIVTGGHYKPSHAIYLVKGYDKDDNIATFSSWEEEAPAKKRRRADKKVKGVKRVELIRILLKAGNCYREYEEYEVIYKK